MRFKSLNLVMCDFQSREISICLLFIYIFSYNSSQFSVVVVVVVDGVVDVYINLLLDASHVPLSQENNNSTKAKSTRLIIWNEVKIGDTQTNTYIYEYTHTLRSQKSTSEEVARNSSCIVR